MEIRPEIKALCERGHITSADWTAFAKNITFNELRACLPHMEDDAILKVTDAVLTADPFGPAGPKIGVLAFIGLLLREHNQRLERASRRERELMASFEEEAEQRAADAQVDALDHDRIWKD